MMRKWLRFVKNEDGGIYPIAGLMLIVILAFAGLLIDGGMMAYQYTKLSSAVDASATAALDGYDRESWEEDGTIRLNQNEARVIANNYIRYNMPEARIPRVSVDRTTVQVRGEASSPVFFMSLFGQGEITVRAMAQASLNDAEDDNQHNE